MDIALVTGADAGPGLAIARRLIGMGCRVYALATQFARNPFPHDDFIPLTVNLADPAALTQAVDDVLAREGHVSFVVHAARRASTPLFDSPVEALTERLHVGLLAPLALARATLPWLRKEKGHFLVLCWNGDGPAPEGPVTAAIEGGLHHFTSQLFDELRDDGVRATTVYARANSETTPEAALALDPQSAVNPELVADAVEHLLRLRPSNVVSTLVIRPAATVETPRLPRSTELAGLTTREVQLPPRALFPREPEPIPTPPRARPADAPPPGAEDFDEEEEDEDDEEWNPETEPLPWAGDREESSPDGPRDGPPRSDGPRADGPRSDGPPRSDSGPPPRRGDYYNDRGPRQAPGRSRGGRGRRRGDREPMPFSNNRRGDLNGPGSQRPYSGPQRPGNPPRGDDRPPARSGPPREEFRDSGRPESAEYPDPESEDAQRALSRDDSFRTPHSDNEPDDAPSEDTDFEREPRNEAPVGPPDAREDDPNQDTDFEGAPPREEDYVPSQRAPAAARSVTHRPHPETHSAPAPRGAPAPSRNPPPRRHRGYGRRPPPNLGGSGRGPDHD